MLGRFSGVPELGGGEVHYHLEGYQFKLLLINHRHILHLRFEKRKGHARILSVYQQQIAQINRH